MNTDEKILKTLGDLQAGQKALQADVQKQGKQIEGLIEVQQKQGTQLVILQADVKGLHGKVDTVELKVEAVHAYQDEIMEHLIESNEINGQAQTELETRIDRIEMHLGLPPLK